MFSYLDVVTDALNKIKDKEEFANHVCYAHTSYHELMHVAEDRWGPSQQMVTFGSTVLLQVS